MNEVFLIGKIITEIDFKFIIKSKKHKSIVTFKLETLDRQVINIVAYNELADYIYSSLKVNENVFIYGKLNSKYVTVKAIPSFWGHFPKVWKCF